MQGKDLQGIQSSKPGLKAGFYASDPECKRGKCISSDSSRGIELPKIGELSQESSSDGNAGKDGIRRGHEREAMEPGKDREAEGEEMVHLSKGPGKGKAPDPDSGEGHDELPDIDGEEESEEEEEPAHELVGKAEQELREGQPGGSIQSVDRGHGDDVLADLIISSSS
jgi:hypothetical protein